MSISFLHLNIKRYVRIKRHMYHYADIGPMDDRSILRISFIVVEKGRMGWAKLRMIQSDMICPGKEPESFNFGDLPDESSEEQINSISFRGRLKVVDGLDTYILNYPAVQPGFRILLRASQELIPLTQDNFRPTNLSSD